MMVTSQTSFLLLLLSLLFAATFERSMCTKNREVHCNKKDREALLIFKQGVVDPYNTLSLWSAQHDCCSWSEVSCDSVTHRVTELVINGYNLQGQINPSLLRLEFLESLSLSENKFNGSIPNWLGQCEHLQYISLSGNLFSSSIPSSIGNLSSLIYLDLSQNQLCGCLPKSLNQLYNLTRLDVGGNSLVGVISKKNFSKLSNLKYLFLGSNDFQFDFGHNWVPPFQLHDLGLRNSSLGPNFPTWLYTHKSLEVLDISSSRISSIGDEDMFWSFVSRIQYVYLSGNSITGDLSNVTINSTEIYLSYNNFTGGLPHLSSKVSVFDASHNSFSGSLFPLLFHPVSSEKNLLISLDVSHNHLTGSLPDCWANWRQLEYLILGSNRLKGELPPSISTLSYLLMLDLHDNNFSGKFSLDISNWTLLYSLQLARNKFSGSLPSIMPQSLAVLTLRSNQFTGNIPIQICNLSIIRILDFADNMLSGYIPHCVYNITPNLMNLGGDALNITAKNKELEFKNTLLLLSIDLSSNNLSGEIPQELLSVVPIWSLNLSRNHLTGKIPQKIGGMKNLESLDLSHNHLSGEIPLTISNLTFLEVLNMSYNNFSGQIPLSTQLQSFEAWSFIGNPELCGDPLPNKCNKQVEYDHQNLAKWNNDDDIFLKSLYLGMGVGFAVGFWGVCSSLFFIRSWRHHFFQWFNGVADRVYVAFVLKFTNFR